MNKAELIERVGELERQLGVALSMLFQEQMENWILKHRPLIMPKAETPYGYKFRDNWYPDYIGATWTNEFKVRMWLVRKLVMLAAWIAPFNMEVKDEK